MKYIKTEDVNNFIKDARCLGYLLPPRNRNMLVKPSDDFRFQKRIILADCENTINVCVIPAVHSGASYLTDSDLKNLNKFYQEVSRDVEIILSDENYKII